MKNNFRTELFPEISPYANGMLPLDNLHTMYWEQSGNETGVPVLFLHGGPGAGSSPAHRCFFDPAYYRIVIYDQRGAGRSTPLGEIHNNTTPHLIDDIEVLRQYLGITEWLVFGGSWGSTLALAYSETYPARCLGLILRGIFLCRKSEIDWFLYGLKNFFQRLGTLLSRSYRHRNVITFLLLTIDVLFTQNMWYICQLPLLGVCMKALVQPCWPAQKLLPILPMMS